MAILSSLLGTGIPKTIRLVAVERVDLFVFIFMEVCELISMINSLDFQALRTVLDSGKDLGMPDGVLINGKGPYRYNNTLVPEGIEHETIQVDPGTVLGHHVALLFAILQQVLIRLIGILVAHCFYMVVRCVRACT